MKILYVEDELSKNIPRITRLFGKYLGKEHVKELELLEMDESGYGATPEEIKRIVESSGMIEVEYRFPDALRKIIRHYGQYAMIIIDRNLAGSEYTLEEVHAIDPAYGKEQDQQYAEREGDYLLLKLGRGHGNVINNVYFLTAYPVQDDLRSGRELETLMNFRQFKQKNVIEKGKYQELKRLQKELTSLLKIPLQT